MTIDSGKVTIDASREEISTFLKDANNLIHILPQDKINDFKSSVEECSFKVQGGIIISLIQDGEEGLDKLFLKSGKFSPFPFRLTIYLTEIDKGTEGYMNFDGQVSPFLKMMVEKPMANLFNYMTKKLEEHFKK